MTVNKETTEETLDRHELEIKNLKAGFPKDEYGEPDYFTHRIFHKNISIVEAENTRKKSQVITNIWSWATIGFMTVVVSGLIQNLPKILEFLAK